MDHNLKMFFLLYGLSMIPWLIAFVVDEREAQWGLYVIDIALSIASYVFLFQGLSGWWAVFTIVILAGIGYFLDGIGLVAYTNLTDYRAKKYR